MNYKQPYIVFEGLDFSGKTSIIEGLKEEFRGNFEFVREPFKSWMPIIVTLEGFEKYEPTIKVGDILNPEDFSGNSLDIEYMLFFIQDRYEKYNEMKEYTKPIISDRSFISSCVYQSNDERTYQDVLNANLEFVPELKKHPIDLVVYLQTSYDDYLERFNTRLENNPLDFITKHDYELRNKKYLQMLEYTKKQGLIKNYVVIKTNQSLEDVYSQTKENILNYTNKKSNANSRFKQRKEF